jgi:uncharacterized repeat protein (TIGR01451 family)
MLEPRSADSFLLTTLRDFGAPVRFDFSCFEVSHYPVAPARALRAFVAGPAKSPAHDLFGWTWRKCASTAAVIAAVIFALFSLVAPTSASAQSADVQIALIGPGSAVPGTQIGYSITVKNNGPDDAANVQTLVSLGAGLTFVSLTQNFGPANGGTLPAGGLQGFTLLAQLSSFAIVPVTVNASVTSTTPDPNFANNGSFVATAVSPSADVSIVKTGPAAAAPGQQISYSITVTNNGPSDALNVNTSDPVPAGTTLVSFTQNTGPANGGPLVAGATQTFTMVVLVGAGTTGTLSNTATVTSTTPDPNSANNSSTVTTTVAVAPTSTTLVSSLNPSQPGQAVTFTATITAAGTPAGTVAFKDGATLIATATTVGNSAAFTTAALAVGSHSITATYSGNAGFGASTSAVLIQVVNVAADSLRLRTLQILATKVVAQNSGQAISSAVDTAIADGFSDGGDFVTPGIGSSMHFNFTSDPDQQHTANSDSTISDRWNGAFPSGRNKSSIAAGQSTDSNSMNNYARNQSPSRVDDALASIDRRSMPTKATARIVEPRDWMLWADVRASGINRWDTTSSALTPITTTTPATLSGSQVNALAGLTRKFNPSFLVGVFGGYETFDYRSDALEGRLKGEGWTAGSYLGWKLTPNIRFTAAAAYSGIMYNGVAGAANGNFDGTRWLVAGGLVGTYQVQAFEIEPSATVYASWEHENTYTDSLGTMQTERKFFTGRASGGAKLIYPVAWTSTITLAPYIGLYGDYYFNGDNAAVAVIAGAIPLASTPILQGWSARAVGGLAARFVNGATIAFGAELGGIGGATEIWTFRARGSVPF